MHVRINRKNKNFHDKKILKSKFYKNKKLFQIDNINVNKTLGSKIQPYCTKNVLIRYNDNDIIRNASTNDWLR